MEAQAVVWVVLVSTHSRLKAAGKQFGFIQFGKNVSTHSRLKAAGNRHISELNESISFNTQPPEGGWCLS